MGLKQRMPAVSQTGFGDLGWRHPQGFEGETLPDSQPPRCQQPSAHKHSASLPPLSHVDGFPLRAGVSSLSQGHGCIEDSVCWSLSSLSQAHGSMEDLLQPGAFFTEQTMSATVLCPWKVPF